MKNIFKLFIVLSLFTCSNDDTQVVTPAPTEETSSFGAIALVNTDVLFNVPYVKPLEAIVFDGNTYVLTENETYKSDELINTNSAGVALDYNVSFIRNNKWHIINQNALWAFDFSSNTWEKLKEFNNNLLTSTVGVYAEDSLYVFSDIYDKIYMYNFDSNSLIEHATFEQKSDYGKLNKSVFEIDGVYYYTKLTDYDKISIYKWGNNFTTFEFLNEYHGEYIANGTAFVYWGNIIFGLGGEVVKDANGNIINYQLNDELYYYDVFGDAFYKVRNNFPEGRFSALPIKYNDFDHEVYLIGGQTIENNEIVYNQAIDILRFSYILD